MNQILTLNQMKTMSVDEIITAYQAGYKIPENIETSLDTFSNIKTSKNYEIESLQHYTTTDIGVIAAAIGISVGILGLFTYYYIKREEKRILKDVRETVLGGFGRYGPTAIEKIVERLTPAAERLAERILPERKSIQA